LIATAGVVKRKKINRVAALIGITSGALLVSIVSLDILRVIEIPGMGLIYEKAGLDDPNQERAVKRVDEQLLSIELDGKRRAELEALRRRLLGLSPQSPGSKSGKSTLSGNFGKGTKNKGGALNLEGVSEKGLMGAAEKQFTADIFSDSRKNEAKLDLKQEATTSAPNLPDGLTQDAISKVIADNTSSMTQCWTEASRKGENLAGKKLIALTIGPQGNVLDVEVRSPEFRNTVMARCVTRRIANWKFPKFNGEPVPVEYPYLLQGGM
jgi:hypothetical protein